MAEANRFSFVVRVYYEDTDFSGNVYHAAYLKFLERARTEFLRAHGVHHAELIGEGIAFAVRSLSIEFEAAAHIDDLLTVVTRPAAATGARLTLEQSIWRGESRLAAARLVIVAIGRDGRPRRLPQGVGKLAGAG